MEPGQKPKKSRKDDDDDDGRTVMDEKIWNEFPKDLLEDIIARLPIVVFFQFRLVCREWNSLLESRNFLQRLKELVAPQNKPWFYCKSCIDGNPETGAIYDTYTKKWQAYPTCTRFIFPSGSVGGLVCHIDHSQNCFLVGNPVMQTWNKFPFSSHAAERLHARSAAVGMVKCLEGYKIITVDHWGVFEVYTSSPSPRLSTRGRIPGTTKLNLLPKLTCTRIHNNLEEEEIISYECTPPVTIDTVVYFLTSGPNGILLYDVEIGVWEQVHIPAPPGSTYRYLLACGNRFLLMGLVISDVAPVVCVWELQRATSLAYVWTEVDRMPKSWCSDLGRRKGVSLKCIGNTGMCMIVLQTSRRRSRMNRIFTYDMVSREWSKVPRFTLPGWRWRHRTDCGVVFYPSLTDAP